MIRNDEEDLMSSKNAVDMSTESKLDDIVHLLEGVNLIVHDFDGVIVRWTDGCEALYGWSRTEAVGKVVHDLLSTQFPTPLKDIREVVRREGAWEGEVVHRTRDGRALMASKLCWRRRARISFPSAAEATV